MMNSMEVLKNEDCVCNEMGSGLSGSEFYLGRLGEDNRLNPQKCFRNRTEPAGLIGEKT